MGGPHTLLGGAVYSHFKLFKNSSQVVSERERERVGEREERGESSGC